MISSYDRDFDVVRAPISPKTGKPVQSRVQRKQHHCIVCGRAFVGRGRQITDSSYCAKIHARQTAKKYYALKKAQKSLDKKGPNMIDFNPPKDEEDQPQQLKLPRIEVDHVQVKQQVSEPETRELRISGDEIPEEIKEVLRKAAEAQDQEAKLRLKNITRQLQTTYIFGAVLILWGALLVLTIIHTLR